jgi:hypothetical protein
MSFQKIKIIFLLIALPSLLFAQKEKENLGDKEYIIVKDYKPVLGESYKISDLPEGDTSSATPPAMDYTIRSKKLSSEYEAGTIKAVKIKDEQLSKLYRTYVKLGMGNYTTYAGDLYVNALRSKKGAAGISLNHFSGNPGLDDVGYAGFSKNHGGVYGKYFFDQSTFSGDVNYNRDVVHYYGYDTGDTIINKDDIKQRFNKFGMMFDYGSNYLSKDRLGYLATFGFSTLSDLYDVNENDLYFAGKGWKKVNDYYLNAELSLNYFKKSLAEDEKLAVYNDISRNIVSFIPSLSFNRDKVNLVLGLNLSMEKNEETDVRLFPKIDMTIPIAENVLYVFAGVNGNIVKNTFQTTVNENPFVTSAIAPTNTINKLELKAGLNGNFSSLLSFVALVKYTTVDRMQLYITDSVYFNKFNVLYVDGNVLNLHAELTYKKSDKLNVTLRFDQYGYSMEQNEEAWHRPTTEMALIANYNFYEKFVVKAGIYANGSYNVRITDTLGAFTSEKVDGYLDFNLGIEYRYSKILSLFVDANNLGFSRYYRWYQYPTERFNVLGGIKYSF